MTMQTPIIAPNRLKSNNKVSMTEKTGPQTIWGLSNPVAGPSGIDYTMGIPLYANGGSAWNPMGFPGYSAPYLGWYSTYRWMLKHPMLRLVRSISVSPIVASKWEYVKVDEAVPDEWVTAVQIVMDNIRWSLLNDFFVRGRDMGWIGGELIWGWTRGRKYQAITRVKPLLHECTAVMVDDHGNFTGLRNMSGNQVDIPAPFKAWKYTFDGECGFHYGRSWLENVRETAWKEWLDCAQQLQRLSNKITGIQTIIKAPAGTFPGPDGKPVSYKKNAEDAIRALAQGAAGVYFPSLVITPDARGQIDAMKVLAELASKSLTTIDTLDFGSQSGAIVGILERMRHSEELMFAGGLRPARSGLEAKHGAKADAEIQTDTGTTNSENDDVDFAKACQPIVDAVCAVNFGDEAVGSVYIRTPSLVNRKLELLKTILLSMVNTQEIARELASTINLDEVLDFLEIKRTKKFDAGKLEVETNKAPAGQPKGQQLDPQGGRPKEL